MFTSALLSALHTGDPFQERDRLSLRTLHRLTIDILSKTNRDGFVRPELHSPDQSEGDIADIPFFPNTPVLKPRRQVEEAERELHDLAAYLPTKATPPRLTAQPRISSTSLLFRPDAVFAVKLAKSSIVQRSVLVSLAGLLILALASGIVWFTSHRISPISSIHAPPTGIITEFPIPTSRSTPLAITSGPDGNLWFTEITGDKIGRITPRGSIIEFPVPTSGSNPFGITTGPDNNLWFTEDIGGKIGYITPRGSIIEFPVPTSGGYPMGITTGPDDNLWFTEYRGDKIGRITPGGSITEFPVPTPGSTPLAIAIGPGGNLWFTEENGDKIGRITPSGSITEFPVPTPGSYPNAIAAGPDGNLWFTELAGDKIGRIDVAAATVISADPDGSVRTENKPRAKSLLMVY